MLWRLVWDGHAGVTWNATRTFRIQSATHADAPRRYPRRYRHPMGTRQRLHAHGFTDDDLAVAVDGAPDPDARLRQLEQLADELADSLDPPGPAQWMRTPNRMLDGRRPLDALADGHDEVARAVAAWTHGTYA